MCNPQLHQNKSSKSSGVWTNVITSYSIHYTKLYELDLFSNVSEGEKAGLSGILNPKVPSKKKLSFSSSEEIISHVENVLSCVEDEVSEPAKKLAELENRKAILEALKDSVKYLADFDLDLTFLGEGSYTYTVSGLCLTENVKELETSLEGVTDGYVEIVKGAAVNTGEKEQKIPVMVTTLKQYMDVVGRITSYNVCYTKLLRLRVVKKEFLKLLAFWYRLH